MPRSHGIAHPEGWLASGCIRTSRNEAPPGGAHNRIYRGHQSAIPSPGHNTEPSRHPPADQSQLTTNSARTAFAVVRVAGMSGAPDLAKSARRAQTP